MQYETGQQVTLKAKDSSYAKNHDGATATFERYGHYKSLGDKNYAIVRIGNTTGEVWLYELRPAYVPGGDLLEKAANGTSGRTLDEIAADQM